VICGYKKPFFQKESFTKETIYFIHYKRGNRMETQRILVTGGAGFIGTNLVHELRKRGHDVIALDMFNTEREDYIRADVRNYRQLERVFDKRDFDFVYHLAAEYGRWNGEDFYENLWQTNAIMHFSTDPTQFTRGISG
jgi:nucleoside-diphosphate-sugar epimerase